MLRSFIPSAILLRFLAFVFDAARIEVRQRHARPDVFHRQRLRHGMARAPLPARTFSMMSTRSLSIISARTFSNGAPTAALARAPDVIEQEPLARPFWHGICFVSSATESAMQIVVAYDGSPSSDLAVEEVLRRPWPAGTKVRLVTVIAPQYSAAERGVAETALPLACWRASLREHAYARVQAALRRFRGCPDLEADYELREGGVVPALLCAIRESEADLVISGSRGLSASSDDPLGSVSDALLNCAPCNVEIVKQPQRVSDSATA